jgi:hypothetical protein
VRVRTSTRSRLLLLQPAESAAEATTSAENPINAHLEQALRTITSFLSLR